MAIPNSLDLATSFGHDAVMSGWFISSLMAGVCAGGVLIWLYNQVHTDGSMAIMRGLNFLGAGVALVGISAYCASAAWSDVSIQGYDLVAVALIGARFGCGFGL